MDIEGLGEERVVQLVAAGLIADPADLYDLDGRAAGRRWSGSASSRRANLVAAIAALERSSR